MKLAGVHRRSIEPTGPGLTVRILDQRLLPWETRWVELTTAAEAARAIAEMWTRGAPLLAMTAAYGFAMALRDDPSDEALAAAYNQLVTTRPTAINLRWALDQMRAATAPLPPPQRAATAYARAAALCDEDVALNRAIGGHGLVLLRTAHARHPDRPLNILTHCNAGWLATVDYGTALAPIYLAHDEGLPVHVWVDETRPRNQGALLTAFELAGHGVPHSVIADNAGGLLMMRGEVDLVIVGADRVAANGDVCNKIGTYLKALAAADNDVPFYVALPYTTIDRATANGAAIPIEERAADELALLSGPTSAGSATVRVTASPTRNPAFDVTPARLVTGYITETGTIAAIA
jgi:methylthioribose-1-phosphate isomerase